MHLEPQVFDLLVYLIENRDRVVTKDDLFAAVWHGRIVSETTLSSRINAARRAIGDTGERQQMIRTIARKGVRFVAPVTEDGPATASATMAPATDPLRPCFSAEVTALTDHVPSFAAARPTFHRRIALHQPQQRSRTGVLCRRRR